EPGAPDPALLHRLQQGIRLHDRSAGSVDQHRTRLHAPELFTADHPASLLVQRDVQADKVALSEQGVQFPPLGPELLLNLGTAPRSVIKDAHIETTRASGNRLPDPAEPDDTQRRTVDIRPQVAHRLPRAPGARAHRV